MAAEQGQAALALTDRHGVYGCVRHAQACKAVGIRPIFGATAIVDGHPLILLARHAQGYSHLCQALSVSHAEEHMGLEHLAPWTQGLICLTGGPGSHLDELMRAEKRQEARRWLDTLRELFPDALYVELAHRLLPGDGALVQRTREVAAGQGLPTVATNAVRYATPGGFPLYDALTCVRLGISVGEAHPERPPNDRSYLCDEAELRRRIPVSGAVERTLEIAERCDVQLLAGEVVPPSAELPEGVSADRHLAELCEAALPRLYGPEQREQARRQRDYELEVVAALELSEFFLVVHEVVEYSRSRGIRCAGRGSAANSILAYLLGITAVCPLQHNLLFERFLHRGRKGMPDIDVDFDSERRDEIIAWMEERFGAEHSAMTGTLVSYRIKSALRDMLKVLGCAPEAVDRVARRVSHWDTMDSLRARRDELQQALIGEASDLGPNLSAGIPAGGPPGAGGRGRHRETKRKPTGKTGLFDVVFELVDRLLGCPRQLGLHSGGMVLSRRPLHHYTPIQRSANGVRQLQFDKDDVEALGLIKFDVLGLRMLSVLSEAVALKREDSGEELDLDGLPLDDEATFRLIRTGKTMSLFQIESPGQVHLISRTQPEVFRDLVVQVALFRPGPLQGGMVNPYVERRCGREEVVYLHPCLEPILRDTLGVILFQEQVLEICHEFAGMSLEEADEFRRLMSRWRDPGCMRKMQDSFVSQAMAHLGIPEALAEDVFHKVEAFVGYGFCRSHAAAFARTVYHSAWLKAHHPAAYMAAVLQHHPGFYPLSTVLEEIRHLGVRVLPVDAWRSDSRYRLEGGAIRLALPAVKGVSEEAARHLVQHREGCDTLEALMARLDLPADVWEALARAGAFASRLSRREALWRIGLMRPKAGTVSGSARHLKASGPPSKTGRRPRGWKPDHRERATLPLDAEAAAHLIPELDGLREPQEVTWDFRTQGLSPIRHPLSSHRQRLLEQRVPPIASLFTATPGRIAQAAGLVVVRQKPPTAKGMVFILLEDETGRIQVAVPPPAFERLQAVLRHGALWVRGKLEHGGASRLEDGTSVYRSLMVQEARPLEEVLGGPVFS